jgi:hypothetical protein
MIGGRLDGLEKEEKTGLQSLWENGVQSETTGVVYQCIEGYGDAVMVGKDGGLVVKVTKKGCLPCLAGVCRCSTFST